MATKQVIFKLGNEEYGMDISLVTTISGYTGVVPIPNAPACIIGILNLRGDVIPVYSLRKKFRMPEVEVTEGTQLLVTKCNNMQVGYKVDSVSGIIAIEEESICAMPVIVKTRETSYAMGVANQKDRLVVLLDIPHILSEQEAEAVKEFAEENERAEEKKKEEQKTLKINNCLITQSVIDAATKLFDSMNWDFELDDYLFKSNKTKGKMFEEYGWKILSDAGKALSLPIIIGSHTMRKSFANIAACVDKSSIDMNAITKIQGLLNHSDQRVTMRYLGTYQQMFDRARESVSDFVLGKTDIHEIVAGNNYTIDDIVSKIDQLEKKLSN